MKKYLITVLIPLAVLWAGGLLRADQGSTDPTSPDPCSRCHSALYKETLAKKYVHQPFLEKKCTVCHVFDLKRYEKEPLKNKNISPHIKWIKRRYTPATEHWFLLPADRFQGSVFIRQGGAGKDAPLQEIELPPLAQVKQLPDNQAPPAISNVRVADIQRGVFISATIRWRTDTVSTSKVRYGPEGAEPLTVTSPVLTKDHELTLTELKPGKMYRFTVSADDVFGHAAHSASLTFSTEKGAFSGQAASPAPVDALPPGPLKKNIFRLQGKYLLELSATTPVTLSLGVAPYQAKRRNKKPGRREKAMPPDHVPMTPKVENSILLCERCHTEVNVSLSHPVNVLPKAGMTIPPEYPTLPDGRISCMSCHAFHGSNNEYRLIRSSKKELCVGCHANML